MDINMEELMSLSEDENDAEEEWRPDKERRVSKKSKVTGVSSQTPTCCETMKGEQDRWDTRDANEHVVVQNPFFPSLF